MEDSNLGDMTATNIARTFDVNRIYARRLAKALGKDVNLEDLTTVISTKPRPFVKWAGGKRQLLKQFKSLDLYPPSGFDPSVNTYYEPFVGGGAVFFDLLPKKAVLSDLNNELVITYNVIRDNVDELIRSLKKHIYDKDYYLGVRSRSIQKLSAVEIASRFIYLNRTGFNGLYRVNKSGQFNVPFGRYSNPIICDEENLMRVSQALQDTTITHGDYKHILKRVKRDDFVYLDPPYYPLTKTASFTSYTTEGFLEDEQIELRDTFIELHKRGCYVMLSNSDTSFIRKLYSGLSDTTITRIKATRTINSKGNSRGKITELVIRNY